MTEGRTENGTRCFRRWSRCPSCDLGEWSLAIRCVSEATEAGKFQDARDEFWRMDIRRFGWNDARIPRTVSIPPPDGNFQSYTVHRKHSVFRTSLTRTQGNRLDQCCVAFILMHI